MSKIRFINTISSIVISFSLIFLANNNIFAQKDTVLYTVDTSKSIIYWKCDAHNGSVILKEGILKVYENKIYDGNFVILMDSLHDIEIDYELMRKTLENTLKSNFFFDTKHYPYSYFDIYYVKNLHDKKYSVEGDLQLLGIKNCIRFPATIHFINDTLKAVTDTFSIDRTKWGIFSYSKDFVHPDQKFIVSDSIKFQINITAVKKK